MSRGKKDREEITNTEEVKETEVSDEMEKAEDSEKAEDDKKPEETKETDDKPVSLYVQEPFIDPSVYRQRRKKRIIRTVTIAVVATLLAVYIGGVIFHMHRFGVNTTINGRNVAGKSVQSVEDMLLSASSSLRIRATTRSTRPLRGSSAFFMRERSKRKGSARLSSATCLLRAARSAALLSTILTKVRMRILT